MSDIYEELNQLNEKEKLQEQLLCEMARVCDFNNLELFVNSKEGFIPHFHLWDLSTMGNEFHTCIRLDKAEYFHHTGKEDKLNSKLRKDLCKILKSKPKLKRYNTYWELVVDLWNLSNPDKEVDSELKMPDYTKLK